MMITEAAIEAAARAVDAADTRPLGTTEKWAEVIARAALEAAAPHMLAEQLAENYVFNGEPNPNPYRGQP